MIRVDHCPQTRFPPNACATKYTFEGSRGWRSWPIGSVTYESCAAWPPTTSTHSIELDVVTRLLDGRMMTGSAPFRNRRAGAKVCLDHVHALERLADSGYGWARKALEPDAVFLFVSTSGFKDSFWEARQEHDAYDVIVWDRRCVLMRAPGSPDSLDMSAPEPSAPRNVAPGTAAELRTLRTVARRLGERGPTRLVSSSSGERRGWGEGDCMRATSPQIQAGWEPALQKAAKPHAP